MRSVEFLFILLTAFCYVYSEEVPAVATTLGKISGIYEISYDGRIYSAFYGIPYAQPPIGNLRFQEPQPISSWSGTWNANVSELYCAQVTHLPQPEGGVYMGDEDCLYLNVFVPRKNPKPTEKPLDVIVHIHGGALMFGSATTYAGARYLMDKDVIFVTFNYRLGVLGFLSTDDDVLPGNNGMKDQVMALAWIKAHIRNFGGNPESITITGLSAGGASVHFHYLSKLSKGLFSRGMSISGNALVPWVLQEKPLQKATLLAAHLGCPLKKTKSMIKCMKGRPTRQLVESVRLLRPWLFNPFSPLGIVIEKAGENKFLSEDPYMLLKKGDFYDVPWITSVTSEEGLYPAADFVLKEEYLPDLEERWIELAPFILDYNYTIPASMKDQVSMKIKKEYLKDQKVSQETYKELLHMMGDRLFSISAEQASKMQAHKSSSPVYFYYFSYMAEEVDSFTIYFTGQDQRDGVSHGDDTMYMFSNPKKPMFKFSGTDIQMKEMFLNMLTSYSARGTPIVDNVKWEPVSKDLDQPLMQLHINSPSEISMEDVDQVDRHRSMWAAIPFKENENLFKTDAKDEL